MPLRFQIRPTPGSPSAAGPDGNGGPQGTGASELRTFELASDVDEVRIGRRSDLEIELPFANVSAVHARLFRGDLPGAWWTEDLGSTNGTWLDDQRLPPRRATPIRAGQRLRIATMDIVFDGWSDAPRGADSTATIARRLTSDLFGDAGGDVATLTVEMPGGDAGESLRLAVREHRYRAGRAEDCDLVLAGAHVSREHVAFLRRWDGVVAFDLGARNGVRVNGAVIPGQLKLADGDRLEIGALVLTFSDPEDRYLRRLRRLDVESTHGAGDGGPGLAPLPLATDSAVPPPALPPGESWPASSWGDNPPNPPPSPRLLPPRWRLDARTRARVVSAIVAGVLVVALAGLVAVWVAVG